VLEVLPAELSRAELLLLNADRPPEDLLLLLAEVLLLEPTDMFSGIARDTEVALFLLALLLALSRDDEFAELDDFAAGAELDEESDAAGALSVENADADPAGFDEDELDEGAELPTVTELGRLLNAGAPPDEVLLDVLPSVEVSPPTLLRSGPAALLRVPIVLVTRSAELVGGLVVGVGLLVVELPRLLKAETASVEPGLGVLVEPPSSPPAVVPRVLVTEPTGSPTALVRVLPALSATLLAEPRVLVTGSVGLVVAVGLSRLLGV
jgi:hypothetical protein